MEYISMEIASGMHGGNGEGLPPSYEDSTRTEKESETPTQTEKEIKTSMRSKILTAIIIILVLVIISMMIWFIFFGPRNILPVSLDPVALISREFQFYGMTQPNAPISDVVLTHPESDYIIINRYNNTTPGWRANLYDPEALDGPVFVYDKNQDQFGPWWIKIRPKYRDVIMTSRIGGITNLQTMDKDVPSPQSQPVIWMSMVLPDS